MVGFADGQEALVLRPSKREFNKPFCEYVREVFAKHPDIPCFKVIPPRGWAPTKKKYNLGDLKIATPIRQHAFGKGGAYMCILEEQRGMTAAEYEQLASKHQAPERGSTGRESSGTDDERLERVFWSSVTINPPLYGADTPISLFDDDLPYGWNLKKLGCLFQEYKVPKIVGVTTPMTYFGMWKSFSGWHKEDIDLNSINYLHFGAPKVWYCVSPKDAAKFDDMARSLFPDLHRRCPAFMRHKDILISPKLLRAHGIDFVTTKQEPGEFVVLGAAAYHSVFNQGFNCAEAVNFAVPEWMEVGKAAVNCECEALPDGVQLDMGIFFPELREEESDSEEEEDSDEEEDSEEEESSEEEEEEQQQQQLPKGRRAVRHPQGQVQRGGKGRAGAKAAAAAAAEPAKRPLGRPRKRPVEEQQQQEQQQKRGRGRPPKRARSESSGGGGGSDSEDGGRENRPANKRPKPQRTVKVPQIPPSSKPSSTPRGAAHSAWGPVAMDKPMALVVRDESTKALSFSLVHRLAKPATKPGGVWVGLLAEGPDGTYRPSGNSKQVQLGVHYPRLVAVRTEWVESEARRQGSWKLTTTARRILM